MSLAPTLSEFLDRHGTRYTLEHHMHSFCSLESAREACVDEEMVAKSKRMVLRARIAKGGDRVIVMAGVPFGTPGSTNVLHIVRLIGDELERHTDDEIADDH